MSCNKEVGEVVSAIIFSVNNQCSFLVELLGVLKVMFAPKRLVKKRLLLLTSSDSKMQNWNQGSRRSLPRFWVRPHRNLKSWNDFMNGNMIPEEWKENFRMLERSFFIFSGKVNMYDLINNLYILFP